MARDDFLAGIPACRTGEARSGAASRDVIPRQAWRLAEVWGGRFLLPHLVRRFCPVQAKNQNHPPNYSRQECPLYTGRRRAYASRGNDLNSTSCALEVTFLSASVWYSVSVPFTM